MKRRLHGYLDVYVWKTAVEKAKSFDVDKVRVAAAGLDVPWCFWWCPGRDHLRRHAGGFCRPRAGGMLEMAVIRRLASRPPDTGDLERQPHPATGGAAMAVLSPL